MYLTILILIILSLFILSEILYFKGVSVDVTRKIIHIGVGVIISIFPFFISLKEAIIFGVLTTVLMFFLNKIGWLKSIFDVKKKSFGARIYVPSLMLIALISWNNPIMFTTATLILALSDGLAGLVGKKFGKNKYNINGVKTFEGSIVFFLTTYMILFIFMYQLKEINLIIIFEILLISLFLTILEGVSSKGWDNFLIPISSWFMIYFLLWI